MSHVGKQAYREVLGFDHSISQVFNLPYRNYSQLDSEALKLLSLLSDQDHSLEFNSKTKEWCFTVWDEQGLYGETNYSFSIREAIIKFFIKQLKKKEEIKLQ